MLKIQHYVQVAQFGLFQEHMTLKEGLKCVEMGYGAVYVMMAGTQLMLRLCADNLVLLPQVYSYCRYISLWYE